MGPVDLTLPTPRLRAPSLAVRRVGCLLGLLPPLLPMLGWALGEAAGRPALFAWFLPLIVFGLVPLIEPLIGEDRTNAAPDEASGLEDDAWFRRVTWAVLPLQLASLLFCGWASVTAPAWLEGVGYMVSCSLVTVATAMTAGHELIHKTTRAEPLLGAALLSTAWYATYKPEHLYGHHVKVGTSADNATAARGENTYAFIARAMRRNPRDGYALQAERLRRRGLRAWSWRNEMVWWTALSVALSGLAFALGGLSGLAFFGGQALVAVFLLELINYVEHYGLVRREADGRLERIGPQHSWSTGLILTNWIVFQLARHGDHHVRGARRYQVLDDREESPRLPFGYPTALLVAAVPPLWRRVMDPRLDAYDSAANRSR